MIKQLGDTDVVLSRGLDNGFDAEAFEFVGGERAFEVSFARDEKDRLAAFEGFFGQLAVGV